MAAEVWRRSAELFVEDAWSEHTTWLGFPVWQLPQDMLALQKIIVEQRPALIVCTGFHLGGNAIYLASIQQLCGIEPHVVCVDSAPNTIGLWGVANHPLGAGIEVLTGSSTSRVVLDVVEQRVAAVDGAVLVVLASGPRRDEVRAELKAYSPLVPTDGWLVAFGGCMQWVAAARVAGPNVGDLRTWATDNALVAIEQFLASTDDFEMHDLGAQLGATFAPKGYLRRVGRTSR